MKRAGSLRYSIVAALTAMLVSCTIGESPNAGESYPDRIGVEALSSASHTIDVSVTVDRKDASYVVSCVEESSMEGLYGEQDLMVSEKEWLGKMLERYGWDEFLSLYGGTGSSTKTFTNLEPDTRYVIYAYCLFKDKKVSSHVSRTSISTKDMSLRKAGNCVWHDVFVCEYNPVLANGEWDIDLEAELYEEGYGTGLYHVKSPYGPANTARWFGIDEPLFREKYENIYWKDVDVVFDASNPAAVRMELQNLGISLANSEGWISAGAQVESTVVSTGKLENGIITFPQEAMLKCREHVDMGGYKIANLDGSFSVKLLLD